ncbi:hypothetical protein AK812_SmicGene2280 [Symbiodinium microadriaticum]|uniref:Peptidase M16 C-terminal domain-containing protein n=1 Tax=Symbiodinium microadriaticum TaxID=2951 RepID=A0A1Q9F1Q6_SYMMI|nr:hypothetical protein AK812_SmicGene2280 [Symbiodinium microadriaticum]
MPCAETVGASWAAVATDSATFRRLSFLEKAIDDAGEFAKKMVAEMHHPLDYSGAMMESVLKSEMREIVDCRESAEIGSSEILQPCQQELQEELCLEHQIANWTVEDLQSFHIRWYVPENATLFIVGDVDEDIAVEKVEQTFNSISSVSALISSTGMSTVHKSATVDPRLATGQPWDLDATSLLRPAIEGFVEPIDGPEEGNGSRSGSSGLGNASCQQEVNVSTNDLLQGMQIAWAAKMPMVPARTVDDLSEWLCQRLVVEVGDLEWQLELITIVVKRHVRFQLGLGAKSRTVSEWIRCCKKSLPSPPMVWHKRLDLAKRMTLDRVKEAGTSREVVDASSQDVSIGQEAMIASFPGSHLLTEAPAFSQALVKAAEEIDLARFNQAVKPGNFTTVSTAMTQVTEELTGRKAAGVQFQESVLRNIDELDESEAGQNGDTAAYGLRLRLERSFRSLWKSSGQWDSQWIFIVQL